MNIKSAKEYYDSIAVQRDKWKKKNLFYHQRIASLYTFLIPENCRILEIGCGTGDLLSALKPKYGMGIDISEKMIKTAKKKYSSLYFKTTAAEELSLKERFDFVIMADAIGDFEDIQKVFENIQNASDAKTRIILSYYNYLWAPLLSLGEKLGIKMPQPAQNWLTEKDIENLFYLANYDIVKKGKEILLPVYIPVISTFFNRYLAQLPILRNACLVQYFVVRKMPYLQKPEAYSVSIVVPARNEEGNIEEIFARTPTLGKYTELIFVEGNSIDNTATEIKRVMKIYKGRNQIKFFSQKGSGKADAVHLGFSRAKGEILMILDADLTSPPEDLYKFYHALSSGKGDYVQGSRLVYPMEKGAMGFLNVLGNKFFSILFTWILDQHIKDTLCGTKTLFKTDYEKIVKNKNCFGDFDPFGDFDLIFGAAKLNLKMVEIPIRYRERIYGKSNIHRFRHGWLLVKMTFFAMKKIKFSLQ